MPDTVQTSGSGASAPLTEWPDWDAPTTLQEQLEARDELLANAATVFADDPGLAAAARRTAREIENWLHELGVYGTPFRPRLLLPQSRPRQPGFRRRTGSRSHSPPRRDDDPSPPRSQGSA